MKFKKALMMSRLEKDGLAQYFTEEEMNGVIAIMDNLDGQEVTAACWARQVKGEAVYGCYGKDGKYYDVAEADCE